MARIQPENRPPIFLQLLAAGDNDNMNDYIKLASDAIPFRGAERLLTIVAAMFFAWFGFRLFCMGAASSKTKIDGKEFDFRMPLVSSVTGLFFMAFGCAVLVYSILTRLELKPANFAIEPTA